MELRYDNADDSKATPKKRTGTGDEAEIDTTDKSMPERKPEITRPDPSIATPHIPEEMPPRKLI